MSNIKVLIIDDSALVRQLLTEILDSDGRIEVVGTAADPLIARNKIKQLNPDVLTLDVEMPRMDGLTFLRNVMRLRPMPVVMISSVTEKGAKVTLDALEVGAVDYVTKPKVESGEGLSDYREDIVSKVLAAARAQVRAFDPSKFISSNVTKPKTEKTKVKATSGRYHPGQVILVGASTGGTEAIKELFLSINGENIPPVVVTQHIPAEFSSSYARRLNAMCDFDVAEAQDGDVLRPNHIYIAPGDYHLRVDRDGGKLVAKLDQSERVNRHRPAVEVMFNSALKVVHKDSIAVMLTGMGSDGAVAMAELHKAGIHTIAQDEATSVVWGMPGAVVALGAAEQTLAVQSIGAALVDRCNKTNQ